MATAKPNRREILRSGPLNEVLTMLDDGPIRENFDPPEIKLALLNALDHIRDLEIELERLTDRVKLAQDQR